MRYLYPIFCLGALQLQPALAGMIPSRWLPVLISGALALSLVGFSVALPTQPSPQHAEQPLIALLRAHHLTHGISTYWSANIVTLQSDTAVTIQAVNLPDQPGDAPQPVRWHANQQWFQTTAARQVQFIVYDDVRDAQVPNFFAIMRAAYGAPDHTYRVGHYTVLAWDRAFDYLRCCVVKPYHLRGGGAVPTR